MCKCVYFHLVGAFCFIHTQAAVLIDFTNKGIFYDGNVNVSTSLLDSTTGKSFKMFLVGSGGNLNSNYESLGINNDTLDWQENARESIQISFDLAVKINAIDLNKVGASVMSDNDKAMVTIGNNAPVLLYTNAANFNGTTDIWILTQPIILDAGESILIEAADAEASFGLQKLNISAIPEPSSFSLLALSGLHLLFRRKKSSTSI